MLIRVERHPLGRRLHVAHWRVHHWHAGLSLIAVGIRFVWRDRSDLWR